MKNRTTAQNEWKSAKTKFTCPTFDMEKKEACSAKFSYKELCQFAALPPRIKEVFEERLGALTAAKFCEYKICPGCQSYVERDHKTNLCVHCTICTAAKGRTYEFCWNCRKECKGQVHTAMCCGNSSCEKMEPSQAKCDSLKLCQPAFKTQKLNTEQIYETKAKSSDRKRLAMIINNVEFRRKDFYRYGSEKDEESMRILLEGLGYHVIILNNLSAEGMKAAFGNFSQCNEHRYSDSTFVVIMSHGGPDGICGIYAEDEEDIFPVEKIFQYLDSENCPGLIGKPKIILIQACRGDTVSNRNGMTGSVFIQILVKIFSGHAHEDDIMELFRKALWPVAMKVKAIQGGGSEVRAFQRGEGAILGVRHGEARPPMALGWCPHEELLQASMVHKMQLGLCLERKCLQGCRVYRKQQGLLLKVECPQEHRVQQGLLPKEKLPQASMAHKTHLGLHLDRKCLRECRMQQDAGCLLLYEEYPQESMVCTTQQGLCLEEEHPQERRACAMQQGLLLEEECLQERRTHGIQQSLLLEEECLQECSEHWLQQGLLL
ncbi:hypothetical protein P4O66_008508 [Electrophorus voltai]|uniref:Caspase family p20 domain-containing protein n=1 Tax=Electrophorus voltai TaxID=2609070 RepID=A0AAD8ZDM9_9TELE|nr:hypothetical protein P4O66_008508 [Electrophorus voltai]